MEDYCRAGRATDDSMALAHCRLDTKGYKYTLSVSNTYCISTVTMVARSLLNVTLFVQYIACVVKALFLSRFVWVTLKLDSRANNSDVTVGFP